MTQSQSHTLTRSANRPLVLIVAVVAALGALVLISKLRIAKDLIPWRQNLSAAQSESTQTGKPIFAYFTADWCGPCQSLKRTTWSDKKVESALQQFVPVKIDIDAHGDLAKRYQVQSIPMFVILDEQGNAGRQIEGALSADELIQWIKHR